MNQVPDLVRGGEVAIYNPDQGLKNIAVATSAEIHFKRAKDQTKLFEAIKRKINAQADYVVWRDGVVVPSQSLPGAGRGKGKMVSEPKSSKLPAADPGDVVALAAKLWSVLGHLRKEERVDEIAKRLSVDRATAERWTKDVRAAEKAAAEDRAYDLWLDCLSQRDIAEIIGKEFPAFAGITHPTIIEWTGKKSAIAENLPPASRQHFDIWQFQTAADDAGAQSYFGALPPQVIENLLWFFTEPGEVIVDLFAGSGTTIDVAKAMGRRVWASDIRGNHYSRHLPIHQHDALTGWPPDAPPSAGSRLGLYINWHTMCQFLRARPPKRREPRRGVPSTAA
jgi:hypothetical protein